MANRSRQCSQDVSSITISPVDHDSISQSCVSVSSCMQKEANRGFFSPLVCYSEQQFRKNAAVWLHMSQSVSGFQSPRLEAALS